MQAQAAEFEQELSVRVSELKASTLLKETAAREKEQLEVRHTEKFQVGFLLLIGGVFTYFLFSFLLVLLLRFLFACHVNRPNERSDEVTNR